MAENRKNTPTLSELDIRSPTWIKLVEIINARINTLRNHNENDHSPEETSKIRGQIKECRKVLALAKKAPPQETDDTQ